MARPFWTSSLTMTRPPTGRDCLPVAMVLITSWRRRIHAVRMKKACRCNPHAHFCLEISTDFNVVEMSRSLCWRPENLPRLKWDTIITATVITWKKMEKGKHSYYTLCIIIPIHVNFYLFVTVRLLSLGKKTI